MAIATPPTPIAGRDTAPKPIVYPERDGKPIAENTLQFEYIAVIHGGLEAQFAEDPAVFVAADNLWYPVEGHPEICTAPDVYVVIGRPKGHRGSYQQWREENIPPQVVFEILSPGNRHGEMVAKWVFYNRYGVEEYYLYDPQRHECAAWIREAGGQLAELPTITGFVSPRLGIRFELAEEELRLFHPNGERFQTFRELMAERDRISAERDRISVERDRITAERDNLLLERDQAIQDRIAVTAQAARLAERLRELGLNPEEI